MSFWDSRPSDVEDIRELPHGTYLGYLAGYTLDETDVEKPYCVLEFRAKEPLSGQDMTNVETNRPLRTNRMYFSAAAKKYTKAALAELNPEFPPSWKLYFENLVGTEAKFEYGLKKANNGKEYLQVLRFTAA